MNAEEILNGAVEKATPAERTAYLDSACGQDAKLRSWIEGLLAAHEGAGSFLERPLFKSETTVDRPGLVEKPGTRIGPYKLLQQIGEGGFGVVYMAEQQEPVRRRVALKIIKPGMDSREVTARFEAERQALAMMDHVNIAKVLEAGATDTGRPYFVMELVHGVPITEFCDKNQLPAAGRLKLFNDVCRAVQHAHQKGIIHRDLKPSNILVTLHDGQPVSKVIDFGVAKAISQQLTQRTLFTAYGQMVGTPAYMSPEQAEMSGLDIDTRSDIYSLGVLLYELLTGTTPLESNRLREAGYAEMQRLIREEEPPRPSTRLTSLGGAATVLAGRRGTDVKHLAQFLRGDLDWIVMKALEKDRNRRYETPGAFAADVDRFLREEAILARPPSALYKLRKFTGRNRAAVLTAAAIVLLLIIGIAGTSLGLVWAMNAEGEAQLDATRARAAEQLAAQRLVDVGRERDGANQARADAEHAAGLLKVAVAQEDSRRLAAHSTAALPTNPGQALLLAIAGAERSPARSALHNNALLTALQQCRELRTLFAPPLQAAAGRTGRPSFIALQVTPDGRRAVAVSVHSKYPDAYLNIAPVGISLASIYDLQTGEVTNTLRLPGVWFATMTISPDGRLLAAVPEHSVVSHYADGQTVVYSDRAVRLWDIQTGKEVRVLTGHTQRVVSLSFDAEGKRLLTASWDKTARIWDMASGKTLHVLADGDKSLELAEFSPDGRRVLTTSIPGIIASSEDIAQTLRRDLFPGPFQPEKVLIDPPLRVDGTILWIKPITGLNSTSGGSGPSPRLWDAGSGKLLAALTTSKAGNGLFEHNAAGFSPDSARAVTMGTNGVSLWNAEDGRHVLSQDLTQGVPDQLLTDGDRVLRVVRTSGTGMGVDADRGPGLLIWQLDKDHHQWLRSVGARHRIRPEWSYRDHQSLLLDGTIDGAPLTAWSTGDVVSIQQAAKGVPVAVLRGHDDIVTAAAFLPDGKRLLTAALDGTLRMWSLELSDPVVAMKRTDQPPVGYAVFLKGGKQVLTAPARDEFLNFGGKIVSLWDATTGKLEADVVNETSLATSALHKQLLGNLRDLDVSPDGTRLVTVHRDYNPCADRQAEPQPSPLYTPVRVWDLKTGKRPFVLEGLRRSVATARFSPDGRQLLTFSDGIYQYAIIGDADRIVENGSGGGHPSAVDLWDAQTGKHIRSLVSESPSFGNFAAWSRDGKRILTNALAPPATKSAPPATPLGDGKRILNSDLAPFGDIAANIFDAGTGDRVNRLNAAGGEIEIVAFSNDGKLVLGYGRHYIIDPPNVVKDLVGVWDAATGAKRFDLRVNMGDLTSAHFSPDSREILTTSTDGTARLWDAATGATHLVLRGHRHAVRAGRFSPDGKWIATASADGTARIWSMETGQEWLTLPAAHGIEFLSAEFSPDSRRILTTSTDGTARIWPLDPLPLAVAGRPRELTAEERASFQID